MIREILDIYNRNWAQILTWSIVIILPVTIFSFLTMIFINISEDLIAPHYFTSLVFVINFIICIPPFVKMVLKDEQDELLHPIEGIAQFIQQFGFLLLFTASFYFIGFIGMYLLFIPTIFALFVMLIFPFFSDSKSVKEVFVRTIEAIAKENVALFGDLLIILSINFGIWATVMLFFSQYDNNMLAYLIIRVVLNILILPFVYIYLTLRYRVDGQFSK
ncbi:hypothetical protein [Solibacillus sp. CAU 1738]|uniref:hypothetical protein n=1 Tax=Solibacillus sp. CAU 1738 TaxID=3140363 RepID=UPI0032604B84